jgi:uncharacterized protein
MSPTLRLDYNWFDANGPGRYKTGRGIDLQGDGLFMKIGVFSDTHDHLTRIVQALELFRAEGVEAVVHAGDICSPFAAKAVNQWDGPLTVVYGNNDGERKGLAELLPGIGDGPVMAEYGGVKINVDHYAPGERYAPLPGATVCVWGHSHAVVNEVRDGVLHLNPGECCGWLHRAPTVAILETDPLAARIVHLET